MQIRFFLIGTHPQPADGYSAGFFLPFRRVESVLIIAYRAWNGFVFEGIIFFLNGIYPRSFPPAGKKRVDFFPENVYFPVKENQSIRENMQTTFFQSEAKERLSSREKLFYPLEVTSLKWKSGKELDGLEVDAELMLKWMDREFPFLVETSSGTAPKSVWQMVSQIIQYSDRSKKNIMILVPFLSKRIVEILQESRLNGIDLNGNYFIQTKDLVAIRLDQKNRYKDSGKIKNAFAGNSSLVARLLLKENRIFEKVTTIQEEIEKLGGEISLGTVSKVLKRLEEELIIDKGRNGIRIIQPGKLLDMLRTYYRNPTITRQVTLKLPGGRKEREKKLDPVLGNGKWVWSGESSAERYAVTTPTDVWSCYTRSITQATNRLAEFEESRFYNCVVKETTDNFVYFDRQDNWASMIQTYLELVQLDKRERQIAEDIAADILGAFD